MSQAAVVGQELHAADVLTGIAAAAVTAAIAVGPVVTGARRIR
jgi:hypothetical protein